MQLPAEVILFTLKFKDATAPGEVTVIPDPPTTGTAPIPMVGCRLKVATGEAEEYLNDEAAKD